MNAEPCQPEPVSHSRFALTIASEAVAGIAGFMVGGPIGAVVGATGAPIILRAVELDRMQLERRANRIVRTVELGAESANCTWQDLDSKLSADPLRSELYMRVLEVAGSSLSEDKIRALARVLASAAPDDAKLDEAFMIAASLKELEQPHIRALALINGANQGIWNRVTTTMGGWKIESASALAAECGGDLVLPAVMGTLNRLGLVHDVYPNEMSSLDNAAESITGYWNTTALGHRCLEFLYLAAPAWAEQTSILGRRLSRLSEASATSSLADSEIEDDS